MRSKLGPYFYRGGIIGMIVLVPVSAYLIFAGPKLDTQTAKLVIYAPFAAFWIFMKGLGWRNDGYWS